jgi:hypothetical protein
MLLCIVSVCTLRMAAQDIPAEFRNLSSARRGRARAREWRICCPAGRTAFVAPLPCRRPPDGRLFDKAAGPGPCIHIFIPQVVCGHVSPFRLAGAVPSDFPMRGARRLLGPLAPYLVSHAVLGAATALSLGPGVVGFSPRAQVLYIQFSLPSCLIGSAALSSLPFGLCLLVLEVTVPSAAMSPLALALGVQVVVVVSRASLIARSRHAGGLAGYRALGQVPACQSRAGTG